MKTNHFSASIILILLLATQGLVTGCASYMHHHTDEQAIKDAYMLVDRKNSSFGYKRIGYIAQHRETIKKLLAEEGDPQYIGEYLSLHQKRNLILYYINTDKAYVYEITGSNSEMIRLTTVRRLSPDEKNIFNRLQKDAAQSKKSS